jgi:hypothetical protein
MNTPTAQVTIIHYDPPAQKAEAVELALVYDHQKVRIYIDLPPKTDARKVSVDDLVPLLQEVGEALLRISETPLSIDARHLVRK